jgi:hypothetical protein
MDFQISIKSQTGAVIGGRNGYLGNATVGSIHIHSGSFSVSSAVGAG